ncbi:MAG: IS1595 family transposase [Bacteroidetes bacterium]|nr:IS1595 family transposase [Bacteroidota bacterium]
MNFFEFNKQFPTELACIKYFITIRYNNQIKCNHCHSNRVSWRAEQYKTLQCNDCNNSFSIFKGTIFEKSCTDLRKWMYAIHLFLNGKKGISGYQLQREIGVTYKTAWRMLKQIRLAMGNPENQEFIGALVEIDETYVGGKPRKGAKKDDDDDLPKNKRGRGTNKNVVVGCVDRTNKSVFAKVMIKNKEGKKLTGKQLLDVLNQVVIQDSTVISDEFKGYNILGKKTSHIHLRVDHTKEFVASNGAHTNNIENFWGTLKRGILGIYHHVSAQHLQKYVDEFCFRYNNRSNVGMFDLVLKQAIL